MRLNQRKIHGQHGSWATRLKQRTDRNPESIVIRKTAESITKSPRKHRAQFITVFPWVAHRRFGTSTKRQRVDLRGRTTTKRQRAFRGKFTRLAPACNGCRKRGKRLCGSAHERRRVAPNGSTASTSRRPIPSSSVGASATFEPGRLARQTRRSQPGQGRGTLPIIAARSTTWSL